MIGSKGLAEHSCFTDWRDCESGWITAYQIKCFFAREESRITQEKASHMCVENQQTQPTYNAESGNRTRATLGEEKRSHHCANTAFYIRSDNRSIPFSSRRSPFFFISSIVSSGSFSPWRTRYGSMAKALPQIPVKLNNKQTIWVAAHWVRALLLLSICWVEILIGFCSMFWIFQVTFPLQKFSVKLEKLKSAKIKEWKRIAERTSLDELDCKDP